MRRRSNDGLSLGLPSGKATEKNSGLARDGFTGFRVVGVVGVVAGLDEVAVGDEGSSDEDFPAGDADGGVVLV